MGTHPDGLSNGKGKAKAEMKAKDVKGSGKAMRETGREGVGHGWRIQRRTTKRTERMVSQI